MRKHFAYPKCSMGKSMFWTMMMMIVVPRTVRTFHFWMCSSEMEYYMYLYDLLSIVLYQFHNGIRGVPINHFVIMLVGVSCLATEKSYFLLDKSQGTRCRSCSCAIWLTVHPSLEVRYCHGATKFR